MNDYLNGIDERETWNSAITNELKRKMDKHKHDMVNSPAHYQGKVECIDAIEAAVEELEGLEAVCTANVIKYVWRWKKKNGREDLEKCRWYLNKLLSLQESNRDLS